VERTTKEKNKPNSGGKGTGDQEKKKKAAKRSGGKNCALTGGKTGKKEQESYAGRGGGGDGSPKPIRWEQESKLFGTWKKVMGRGVEEKKKSNAPENQA